MFKDLPLAPIVLGLCGLIPFLWGGLTTLNPPLALWAQDTIGSRFIGPYIQLFYGAIILSFMSGVIWGFATKSTRTSNYILAVIPALWAFFMTGGGPATTALNLMGGFGAVLLIDWHMASQGLTPPWWMPLRIVLTIVVIICLMTVVI